MLPGVGQDVLQAERDPPGLPVDPQHRDREPLSPVHDLGGMLDVRPGHLADRQQAVDAAEVHERAKIGEAPHDPLVDLSFLERDQQLFPRLGPFLGHGVLVREDDPSLGPIDFEDPERDALPDQGLKLPAFGPGEIHVAPGDEPPQSQVHHEPALDLVHHHRVEDRPGPKRLLDAVPGEREVGALLAEEDVPLVALDLQHVDVDPVADGDRFRPVAPGRQLLGGNESLGLRADVHEHPLVVDAHDGAADDLPLLERLHAGDVHVLRLFRDHLVLGHGSLTLPLDGPRRGSSRPAASL